MSWRSCREILLNRSCVSPCVNSQEILMHTFCHRNRTLLRSCRNELWTLKANVLATSDSHLAAFGSVTLMCLHGKRAALIWVSSNNTFMTLLSKLVTSTNFLSLVAMKPVSREIYLSFWTGITLQRNCETDHNAKCERGMRTSHLHPHTPPSNGLIQ